MTSLARGKKFKLAQKRGCRCELCGYNDFPQILVVHHKIQKKHGGTNDESNLIVLCPNCHALEHFKNSRYNFINYRKSEYNYHKQWYTKNPDKLKAQNKRKYRKHKKHMDAYNKIWAKSNKDKIRRIQKKYYQKCKARILNDAN